MHKKVYILKQNRIALLLLIFSTLWILTGCKIETPEQHAQSQLQSSNTVSPLPSSALETPSLSSVSSLTTSQPEENSSSSEPSSHAAPADSSRPKTSSSGQESAKPAASNQPQAEDSSSPASSSHNTAPEPDTPAQITVTLSIRCDNAVGQSDAAPGSGVFLSPCTVSVPEGSSVFTALKAACATQGITLVYNGNERMQTIYIEGINGLFEKDCGPTSGWKYRVNGSVSGLGCSAVFLSAHDTIEWYYAIDVNQ